LNAPVDSITGAFPFAFGKANDSAVRLDPEPLPTCLAADFSSTADVSADLRQTPAPQNGVPVPLPRSAMSFTLLAGVMLSLNLLRRRGHLA
jgi:hypothetical protein